MLTAAKLKETALENCNIDKIGIAGIERFKDAPPDMSPLSIMPNAKSVIVFFKRIPRGCFRGIDEGTHWPSYTAFGYAGLGGMLTWSGYKIAKYIEDNGYEAVTLASSATSREFGPRGPKNKEGKPRREVTMQHRIAAVLAGLGEIGWSKIFLSEEFGPRQRIGIILTDAKLEQDPIKTGILCDKCKLCVAECPGGAISKDKEISIEVEGHKISWGDIDLGKCKLTHFGLNRKNSPHFIKRFPGVDLPTPKQEVSWLEAHDLGWALFPSIPTYNALSKHGYIAMCGARGCMIGCMKHMERKGKVKNVFAVKKIFSEKKPWVLPEHPSKECNNGLVYDPGKEVMLQGNDSDKSAAVSTWY